MAASTPEKAKEQWLKKLTAGVAKYRAKLGDMKTNYSAGLTRFWGSAGPVTTGSYNAAMTEDAANNLAAKATSAIAEKWLANARKGATR